MKPRVYDRLIFIHPSLSCNFSCVYCGRGASRTAKPQAVEIERIVDKLNTFNKTFLVCIGGGEPFLIPNFTAFVSKLTEKHYVRIDSNLSLTETCKQFARTINPEKIWEISYSTHPLEREKRTIDRMEQISLVQEFQNKGFKMVGNYVAYPPLLKRMEKDMEFYKARGITVLPILFSGIYDRKLYPLGDNGRPSYSKDELDLITRYNPYAVTPLHNPKNEFCQAGSSVFWAFDAFEVFPCHGTRDTKIGDFFGEWNIFPKVIRCPNTFCRDQYNKGFSCTLDRASFKSLLAKTIAEKGEASALESFKLLRRHWLFKPFRKLQNIAGFLRRKLIRL